MKRIRDDGEFKQLQSAGKGFIYNDFSKNNPDGIDNNILHAANCHWLTNAKISIPKYFFETLDEALTWLQENRSEEERNWKRCDTCGADNRSTSININSPEIKFEQKATQFIEANVEDILVRYLQKTGYSVRRQVTSHNGIIDVVAEGSDGHWIIEVKGEDKGGFGTAQMNFQMGIGQIVSRMNEPGIFYALAIPMTDNFKRIMKNYKGSLGFKLLSLWFFVIHRDGQVDKYDASAMSEFIGRLR